MMCRVFSKPSALKQRLQTASRAITTPAPCINRDKTASDASHRFGRKTLQLAPTPSAPDRVEITVRTLSRWTNAEKQHLLALVSEQHTRLGTIDWTGIAQQMPGGKRTLKQCRSMYANIQKQMRTAAASRSSKKSVAEESLAPKRKKWTPEEDRLLMALRAVGGTSWKEVAEAMGDVTVVQCKNRSSNLRARQGLVRPPLRRGPKPSPYPWTPTHEYKSVKQGKAEPWTKDDDERLRRILAESRTFDIRQLHQQFPNKNYRNMYIAMYKLCTQPELIDGRWSNDEHRSLLRLVSQYGCDWPTISAAMPTGRTHTQCRSHYITCCVKPGARRGKWSDDETARLLHLVNLECQKKLSDSSQLKSSLEQRYMQVPGRFLGALQKDTSGSAASAAVKRTPPKQIDWTLIATHMETRTASQCRAKYGDLCSSQEDDFCSDPWTREEDLVLYKLYQKRPRKWTWIIDNLPRARHRGSVVRRYNHYIGRCVDMLRRCQPNFDPLYDDMQEIHMRCEVLAWYHGKLEGYRDPAKCPDDMDLTGLRKLRKERDAK